MKLVSQPPLQLLAALSSLAILASTESDATDGARAVDDAVDRVRREIPVSAVVFDLWSFVACFGASTVTPGSEGAEPGVICDAAGPHSRTVASTAAAEDTTTLDDNLMTISLQGRTCRPNTL
ncbi:MULTISPECIES: hypothetical protein [unclassified Bradyrhizobium]|uniref:hypothetical protein n=1 Tax=Bradyrhizobium TaxID=374 RepID=UPI0028EA732B|nr:MULTISPECIES: hypothetical protein [unclassified Bradyrhizobium]